VNPPFQLGDGGSDVSGRELDLVSRRTHTRHAVTVGVQGRSGPGIRIGYAHRSNRREIRRQPRFGLLFAIPAIN